MSKPQLRVVKNESQHKAEIFLYGIIGDFWYSDDPLTARAFQQQLSLLSDYPEIHIHINSPGGDCLEGLAICNAIKSSKKIIHTYNDGICASMAATILCAGKDGHRHAAKGSLTMFHSASTICWGNAEDMRNEAETLDKYDDVLAEIIADALGKTLEETKAMFFDGKDHWLTAKEAEAEGLVIIDDYASEDMPENPTSQKFSKVAAFYSQKFNNSDMSLFKKAPFKNMSALAKKPVADITDENLKAVQDELLEEGIEGLSIVKTEDLNEAIAEAEKVEDLNKKVTDLETEKTTLTAKVASLEKDLGKKPAVEATAPVATKTDGTPAAVVVEETFETSVDAEAKKYFS